MRIGFAGTPDFAATILQALIRADLNVVRVLSQPPRPFGRGRKVRNSPVQDLAESHSLSCHTPSTLRGRVDLVRDLDVLVVAAYGLILPEAFFSAPRLGSVNAHASLLPRWRGASPVEHAIFNLDEMTGISLMQITKGLDQGPIYTSRAIAVGTSDTSATLTQRLAALAGDMMVRLLSQLASGTAPELTPQDSSLATYAPKLTPQDACIDWQQPATHLHALTRAFQGRSAAWTSSGDIRLKIVRADVVEGQFRPGEVYQINSSVVVGCGSDGLALAEVQLNRGKGNVLPIKAAMNGFPQVFASGARFE